MEVTPLDAVTVPAADRSLGAGPRGAAPLSAGLPRGAAPDATLAADADSRIARDPARPVPARRPPRAAPPHPCGGRTWEVDRLGADIGLRCATCGRHVLLERRAVERRLVGFAARGPEAAPAMSLGELSRRRRREPSGVAVFRNRPFLLLWLSQLATQVGGNMVLYGLTVLVRDLTALEQRRLLLILTFLAPAVIFSALAGVYVDRFDRRKVLVVTNLAARGPLHRARAARHEHRGRLRAEHGRLDRDDVLRAGRALDDPARRAARASSRRPTGSSR